MTDESKKLCKAAELALNNAYSPYSKIKIGAAVLGESGKIYTGANIENASFGATICAERTAIVKAISEGEKTLKAIAITGDIDDHAYPCGICRQVMSEFMKKNAIILVGGKNKEYLEYTLEQLLPNSFDYYEKRKEK